MQIIGQLIVPSNFFRSGLLIDILSSWIFRLRKIVDFYDIRNHIHIVGVVKFKHLYTLSIYYNHLRKYAITILCASRECLYCKTSNEKYQLCILATIYIRSYERKYNLTILQVRKSERNRIGSIHFTFLLLLQNLEDFCFCSDFKK